MKSDGPRIMFILYCYVAIASITEFTGPSSKARARDAPGREGPTATGNEPCSAPAVPCQFRRSSFDVKGVGHTPY
jgi:hypothetical protein